ncbi:MAG: sulfatase-like hydrolase/transferase [Proteobacteria bacterium]|nr:sulfatase-like hydrolase/transferase [Pseudomonadota bacterium]
MRLIKKNILFVAIALFHFFLARLAILLLYNSQFSSLEYFQIFKAFFEGLRFDFASIIVFFSIPLLLMNIPLKIVRNRYWQGFCSWILYAILMSMISFLLGDVVYFDFVKRHVTYELFVMGGEDAGVIVGMLFGVFLPYLILFLVDAVVVFVLWMKIAIVPLATPKTSVVGFLKFAVFFVALVVLGRGGLGYKPITIIDAYASGNTNYGNLLINGIFSISHSSLKAENVNHRFFEEREALEILGRNEGMADPNYPFQRENQGESTKYNVVFILIESLSFKYVDAFARQNYGVTPNLDALAKRGLKFVNFYSSGQRSVEGLQATLTGIPSIIGLPTIGIGLLANYSKLGILARENGYSTLFVESMKRRSFRIDAIAGSTGFQEFYGMEDMPIILDYPDPKAAKYGWDYETYMFAAEKMEAAEKPFLTYIVTSTTHTPYPRLPKGLEKHPHHENSEEGFLNTLYYTDWSIGEFMKRLKKHPWFDRTVFIFTADHALAHYQGGSFQERFRIPLVVYAPAIFEPKVVETVGSQVDIFASIVDILGLKGKYSAFGRSLFSSEKDDFAFVREGSIMGIATEKGYLRHSLKNRLETGYFQEKPPKEYFDLLEKKLLAADQLTYELLQANRWAE